jgi:hypothetical protein
MRQTLEVLMFRSTGPVSPNAFAGSFPTPIQRQLARLTVAMRNHSRPWQCDRRPVVLALAGSDLSLAARVIRALLADTPLSPALLRESDLPLAEPDTGVEALRFELDRTAGRGVLLGMLLDGAPEPGREAVRRALGEAIAAGGWCAILICPAGVPPALAALAGVPVPVPRPDEGRRKALALDVLRRRLAGAVRPKDLDHLAQEVAAFCAGRTTAGVERCARLTAARVRWLARQMEPSVAHAPGSAALATVPRTARPAAGVTPRTAVALPLAG